jgi:hypothetical protein
MHPCDAEHVEHRSLRDSAFGFSGFISGFSIRVFTDGLNVLAFVSDSVIFLAPFSIAAIAVCCDRLHTVCIKGCAKY